MLTSSHKQHFFLDTPLERLRDKKSGTAVGDSEVIPPFLSPSRGMVSQTKEFLRDRARRKKFELNGSPTSTCVLVTWFQQRFAITLQRAQAREVHARRLIHVLYTSTYRLENVSNMIRRLAPYESPVTRIILDTR